eukprot:354635-Chlamydomonas_euryale.AAC.7
MHIHSLGPASASAGMIGRDRRPRQACLGLACKDDPAKVSHVGTRGQPPHAYSRDGIGYGYEVANACMNECTCVHMHVALSWYINERLSNNDCVSICAQNFTQV